MFIILFVRARHWAGLNKTNQHETYFRKLRLNVILSPPAMLSGPAGGLREFRLNLTFQSLCGTIMHPVASTP